MRQARTVGDEMTQLGKANTVTITLLRSDIYK